MPDVLDNNLNIPGLNTGDQSGYSASVNRAGQSTVIVGEPGADRVRVFSYDNGWVQIGDDISGPSGSQFGRSVFISDYATRIYIGAPNANNGAGLVRAYKNVNGEWFQIGTDNDMKGTGADNFGYSIHGTGSEVVSDAEVTTSTDKILISAPGGNSGKGLVRVYENDSRGTSGWTKLGDDLADPYLSNTDQFGYSVHFTFYESDRGDYEYLVFVGCPGFNNGNGLVKVYTYHVSTGGWVQPFGLFPQGTTGSMYGYSISSYNRSIAVGSPGSDTVTIIKYTSAPYPIFSIDSYIHGSTGEQFGTSISVSGNSNEEAKGNIIIAVGCPAYSSGRGRIKLFGYLNNQWQQIGNSIEGSSASGQFGYSVSLNNFMQVAIGEPFTNSDTGVTRVLQWDRNNQGFTQYIYEVVPELVADVCFPKGTPIETDQGPVDIDLIDPKVHTMNQGDRIVAVTRTLSHDPWLVRIPKGLLGNGLPTRDTIISNNHKVMHKGRATRAIDLTGVSKTPYNPGETLYNVLLEYHSGMVVNGLLVETLDPDDIVAQVFKVKDTPLYSTYVKMLNDRRIMITSSSGTK